MKNSQNSFSGTLADYINQDEIIQNTQGMEMSSTQKNENRNLSGAQKSHGTTLNQTNDIVNIELKDENGQSQSQESYRHREEYEMLHNTILFNKIATTGQKVFQKIAKHEWNEINYKNLPLLRKFLSKGGRILPIRLNHISHKQQRMITKMVKKARMLALLPFDGR